MITSFWTSVRICIIILTVLTVFFFFIKIINANIENILWIYVVLLSINSKSNITLTTKRMLSYILRTYRIDYRSSKMSRFFANGSDSESDSTSEEEQVQRVPTTAFTVNIDFCLIFCFIIVIF